MKAKLLSLGVLLLAGVPGISLAADRTVHLPFADAVVAATQSGKLDGSVKFYLAGNRPAGHMTVVNDNIVTHKKTNAFHKGDAETCNWALQSALISLQDAAKAAGANAVVGIVSRHGNHEYSDPKNYECQIGFLMSDVELKAKLAKIRP